MSHPTDNPNGGVEEPVVPTPRPDHKNEAADPNRYDQRGEEYAQKVQDEIRWRTESPAVEAEDAEEEDSEEKD